MSRRLSFSIVVNLLTENFKKGTNTVKDSLRSMQMQVLTFVAALGAGGLGISGLIERFRDVARETSRVLTALKNVSGGTKGFADNLRFVNDLAKRYGLEINALTGNFAKFTASATQANMPMEQQKKVFESVSRAITAFGLSASESDGVMLALSQMMSKGKLSMEELRKQMGEKLPVAMQAMAKALGVSIGEMEKLISTGKVMSADVLPKFADALNEIIPNVDTDNLETSLSRLSNMFGNIVDASGFTSKYKALVDGLTSLLESASKNIQNIIVGIVAAIGFVVTNGLTKVYRGYATNGQMIVANATTTHNKLRSAIAARVEAEIALEKAKAAQVIATQRQQLQATQAVEKAKQKLSDRTTQVSVAHENAKAAAAQAAAIKSRGAWATAGAAIWGSIKKIGVALKSMWNSFAPAIIISAIIAIVGHFKNLYDEAKRVKNIFSDYKKEVDKIGSSDTQEIKMLKAQLSIMNDKTKSQKEVNTAQAELRRMLGLEKTDQSDLNKLVAERIGLLRAAAKADFYVNKSVEVEDKIKNNASSVGLTDKQIRELAKIRENEGDSQNYVSKIRQAYKANGTAPQLTSANIAIKETIEDLKILADIEKEIGNAVSTSNKLTPTTTPTTPTGGDPDNKALRAAEKRLEALRKLDEAEHQRQIEKLAFDNEMRQKDIDAMDDGFAKQYAILELNYSKELKAIEDYKQKIANAQHDEAKTQYIAKHGTDKGFDHNKTDLSALPKGLRPADVVDQTAEMAKSVETAWQKGLTDLWKEENRAMGEESLRFATELDKQLAELEAYYAERIKQHEGNESYINMLLSNKDRERTELNLIHKKRMLDFESEYSEKLIEYSTKYYVFQSDKDKELLQQKISSKRKEISILEKQVENDPDNNSLANSLKMARLELNTLNNEITKLPVKKFKEMIGFAQSVASSFEKITGTMGLSDAIGALDGAADSLMAFKSGDVMGGISSGMGTVASIVSLINGGKERQAAIQREINKLQQEYNINLRQQNYELISSIDYARIYKDNIEALNWLIKNGFAPDTNYNKWEEVNEQIDSVKENQIAAQKEVDKQRAVGIQYLKGAASGMYDMKGFKHLEAIAKEWESGAISMEEALLRLDASGVKGVKDLYDRIERAKNETVQWKDEMVALFEQLEQFAVGTNFDSFLDDAMSAIYDMRNGVSDLAEFTEKSLTNAILSSFKYRILSESLKGIYDKFSDKFINDFEGIDKEWVDNWKTELNETLTEKGEMLNDIFESLGIDSPSSSSNQQSSKGYSVSMDQDTGDKILGRATAMQMSGLKIEGLLSAIFLDTANIFKQTNGINSELVQQTKILNNIYQVQRNSFFEVEGSGKNLKDMNSKLSNIEKYTKALE